ncbi:MAG: T9SS type A sorting domain-containing protein [Phaeodactylibacter sp.]|nr:T9SS type A sorting domain-containing protein [Phaeodactylibacter sp.]
MMQRYFLSVLFFQLFLGTALFSQDYRTFDGTGNNLQHPEWGAANSQFPRITPVSYGDGVSTLGGVGWPNPRKISNDVFSQTGLLNDPLSLSDYCWVWGQFIDHDVTFAHDDPGGFVFIQVPAGDPWFDPWNIGQAIIVMRRSVPAPGTGTGPDNPRQHINSITSFIDGSGVYGSDETRANWLRTFSGGKLKTSAGNLLPFNTIDGEYESDLAPDAPAMDNPVGISDKLFVAGDARANENNLLTAFHTLFVREHNRLCDDLVAAHPDWNDEQLYQHARKLVGAFIQNIVYAEWLPTMGMDVPDYTGYDPTIDPGMTNLFSAAAFRLGHTLLTDTIRRMDLEGNTVPEGDLQLRDAFFNPAEFMATGMDPFFKGMGVQIQQSMDSKVIDAVRNFLFGEPGSGGLDLASINITRGRERGIPDFNTVRTALNMLPYSSFSELCSDPAVVSALESLYGTIDHLDAWVGLLSEDRMTDALFGPTHMHILEMQFMNTRDGDRYYFENDPLLTNEDKQLIKNTRLVDIIMRNTNIEVMQENVFVAMPHEMLCTAEGPVALVEGNINTETGLTVGNVAIEIYANGLGTNAGEMTTDPSGEYVLNDIPTCESYELIPSRNDDPTLGVSTLDIVVLQKHILGLDSLDTPYQYIAADANNSETITTLDLVELRKVILYLADNFTNNTSWRFVEESFAFTDATNPWLDDFPETVEIANLVDTMDVRFIAIKIGDVNNSVSPNDADGPVADRGAAKVLFRVEEQRTAKADLQEFPVYLEQARELAGYQFTLNYDPAFADWVGIRNAQLADFTEGNFNHMREAAAVTFSWNGSTTAIDPARPVFYLQLAPKTDGVPVEELLSINSRYVAAEAYDPSLNTYPIGLFVQGAAGEQLIYNAFEVYQNIPNPVRETTRIGFYLPEESVVEFRLYDELGRMVHAQAGTYGSGMNEIQLDQTALKLAPGIYSYQVESEFGEESRSMVVVH